MLAKLCSSARPSVLMYSGPPLDWFRWNLILRTLGCFKLRPKYVFSWPATQRYPRTTNSLSVNYRSVPYSPMQPPYGATHHRPIIDISKYYNPNVPVIGDYPRRTPIPHLHSTLSLEPIHEFVYRLTAKFFHNCSTHPNPLVCQIGNYTLLDLHVQYRKYIHKRIKHLLL